MDEFTRLAEEKFNALLQEEKELKDKIKSLKAQQTTLKAYLIEAGVLKKATRKKRTPKSE